MQIASTGGRVRSRNSDTGKEVRLNGSTRRSVEHLLRMLDQTVHVYADTGTGNTIERVTPLKAANN